MRPQELIVHAPALPGEVGEDIRPGFVDHLRQLFAGGVRDAAGQVEQVVLGLLQVGQRAPALVERFEYDANLSGGTHLVYQEPQPGP